MRGAATARAAVGLAAAALVLAARPATAAPLEAGSSACGGNAYSSAEVTEGRGRRRGPLTAVPDTLCADLETAQPPVRIDIYGIPGGDGSGSLVRDGSASGLGGGAGSAPYERAYRRRPSAD